MTHDYKRNGTTTLFAALNTLDGTQTYITSHNAAPKPFIWTATAKDILAKVARARKVLDAARRADTPRQQRRAEERKRN